MRRWVKLGGFVSATIALAFTVRDVYRIITVPAYSPNIPAVLPTENVSGFRNAYPFTYAAEMTDIAVGDSETCERWYTDGAGYFISRKGGSYTAHIGKRIDTYDLYLDNPYIRSEYIPATTHYFGFTISGVHDLPIGIALAGDPDTGAKAHPVSDIVYSTLALGPKVRSDYAYWENGNIRLIGRYNIPKAVSKATVSVGIATRNHAILYGESPMPGWLGRKSGADLALKPGAPSGCRKAICNPWRKNMITVRAPELPTGNNSLAPYAFAVYAVTFDGREHVMRVIDGFEGVGEAGYICDYIPRENICAVRVLVAPYLWTRFKNVPLHYGK